MFAAGPDPAGDSAFQATLCEGFLEEDFASWTNGASVPEIQMGPVTIDVNIVDGQGNPLAGDARIFASGAFDVPDVLFGNALVNISGTNGSVGRIELVFSPPVESFGAWMFDDWSSDDPISIEVLETDGSVHADGPRTLMAGSGIEGFFGYRSCTGIQRLRIGIASTFLELDHIQIGKVIPAAQAVVRNGSGVNRACYASAKLPVLGQVWSASVDARARPSARRTIVFGCAGAAAGLPSPYGELLVDPASRVLFRSYAVPAGGMSTHTCAIPADPCLAGLVIHTQAAIVAGRVELCNAIDLTIGH